MKLQPRLDSEELEYFEHVLKSKPPQTKMVEWGSGGSTVAFLPYFGDGSFISIEHNREWFDKVTACLQSDQENLPSLRNFTYILSEPKYLGKNVDLRFYGYGVPFEENPCFAREYINPETERQTIFDADIFFIDGICRGAVLATILKKHQKAEAQIYVHDYYGAEHRESWYDWASCLFSGVERIGTTLARLRI
jgi:hypothetical protein